MSRPLPPRRLPSWAPLLDERRRVVMRIPGVVGVGIGGLPGSECVVVTVLERTEAMRHAIENVLGDLGFRVDIEAGEPLQLY